MAVFSYLRDPDVSQRFINVREEISNQIVLIENNVPSARGLTSLWDEFQYNYFWVIWQNARRWVLHSVQQAREAFENTQDANENPPPNRAGVLAELRSFEEKID